MSDDDKRRVALIGDDNSRPSTNSRLVAAMLVGVLGSDTVSNLEFKLEAPLLPRFSKRKFMKSRWSLLWRTPARSTGETHNGLVVVTLGGRKYTTDKHGTLRRLRT